MPRFLIEVPHGDSQRECLHAIDTFLRTGSHFLRNADWGCKDGEHKAWLTIDVESKADAKSVVPPDFRANAKVVQLTTYTREDMEQSARQHGA